MKLLTLEELFLDSNNPVHVGLTDKTKYHACYSRTVLCIEGHKIIIIHTKYLKKIDPIICEEGNFYNKETGECLGKSFVQYIYFMDGDTPLKFPKLVPDAEWRID